MRSIKFRAFNPVLKIWIYGFLNDSFFDCSLHPDGLHGDETGEDLEDITLDPWQQFTGLLDKNGKEIYEGDILKVGEEIFTIGWYSMSAAFWLFHQSPITTETRIASGGAPARNWNFLNEGSAIYWHGCDDGSPEVEVIGNIYENPKLLNP